MGYDEVIPLLGEFGRYQRRIYVILCLPAVICAFHKLGNVFLQAKPPFRCLLPNELSNASYLLPDDILNVSYPYDATTHRYESCSRYDLSMDGSRVGNATIIACNEFVYDRSTYHTSTVMEWGMVCSRAYMSAVGDSIFMLGVMIGSIVFGDLSDRYGRKPVFFMSLVIQVTFGAIATFAPEYWSFTAARAVIGATTSGVFLVAYVIGMEMVGPSYRLFAGVACQMFFSVGFMLTALLAYLVPEWRRLQLTLTLPGLVFLSYWWFVPESARWLLMHGRTSEAVAIVRSAARENGVVVEDARIEELLLIGAKPTTDKTDTGEKKATVLDVFKHTRMRNRALLIFFDWLVNSMTYYGLSWNTSKLGGGNDYINSVISGGVEIPAYLFLLFTLNRWGRRTILCGCMVAAGIALLLTMAIPADLQWLTITLVMLGKLAITASYGTVYIFSTEQFPTVIRNAGLGAASTSARIGSIMAPLINLTSETWRPMPLIIFGVLSLSGGVLSLMLPETLNRQLPETMADGEKFGRRKDDCDEEATVQMLKKETVSNGTVATATNEEKHVKIDVEEARGGA